LLYCLIIFFFLKRGVLRGRLFCLTGLAVNVKHSGQNGEYSTDVVGGTNSFMAEGRLIVRSLLDGRETTGPSNTHETNYNFEVKLRSLDPTRIGNCVNFDQYNYSFGAGLTTNGCGWYAHDNTQDMLFSSTNTDAADQNYHFVGTNKNGFSNFHWNYTRSHDSYSLYNRALGNVFAESLPINFITQASNGDNAVGINESKLLGLQSVNPSNNRDSNTYRPQLQTNYLRINDYLATDLPNKVSESGIDSFVSRTGH
jgi:hypothetical protein